MPAPQTTRPARPAGLLGEDIEEPRGEQPPAARETAGGRAGAHGGAGSGSGAQNGGKEAEARAGVGAAGPEDTVEATEAWCAHACAWEGPEEEKRRTGNSRGSADAAGEKNTGERHVENARVLASGRTVRNLYD